MSFDNPSMGDNSSIKRLMRSIHNSRPSNQDITNMGCVNGTKRNRETSAYTWILKDLTIKLLMLCALFYCTKMSNITSS